MRDFGFEGGGVLPGRHHLTGCSKTTSVEWVICTSLVISLSFAPCVGFLTDVLSQRPLDSRESKTLLFVFDLGKWHLYEVASQTDGPPRHIYQQQSEGTIEFPDSPSVSCSLSATPLYESPCQCLWSQTTLFYCMDMSVFPILTRGEDFQGLRCKK